jgi:glycosyltransferase involved in cell wall biosynthesis
MSGPRVSVVMPTYNHRNFVLATLQSVFDQTVSDYEVIVVNDGSPDDTHEVLAPLRQMRRITYLEQANAGQSKARNRGLEEARGEFIAFLDDDDLWPTDKLEWQVSFLDSHPDVGMVGGTLQTIDERGAFSWQGRFFPDISFRSLFVENPFHSPGQTLIRSSVLRSVGGMTADIWGADDWDLWFRIAERAKIVMVDRLGLYYRLHPGNASRQTARLLAACCSTIEHHLRHVPTAERGELRRAAHQTLYNGLGALLVTAAKQQLRERDLTAAIESLRGLQPLARGIALDHRLLRLTVRDLFR